MRIVIVGAGVEGLMSAWRLRREGCEVRLLERGRSGGEASWAGGGILSPLYPWRAPAPVDALSRLSQAMYPALCDELAAATGVDPQHRVTGLLILDTAQKEAARRWAARCGEELILLQGEALRRHCPPLSARFQAGLWLPRLANVRNPRLLRALRAAVVAAGVELYEDHPVATLRSHPVPAAVTADGAVHAGDAVVVCAGAWSADLLAGLAPLPVAPVKGQMLLFRLPPGRLPTMVLEHGHYLVPRADGHVLCGSTLEFTGFDKGISAAARQTLHRAAAALCPELEAQPVLAHWAGLRPGSPDGIPRIGPVPGQPGLWVNTGHFRNGLVLAPASARLLADLLLQRPPLLDPAPYRLQ